MFKDAENLIQESLRLSPEERVRIADRLYESIPEKDAAGAWIEEVERREADWDNGSAREVDTSDVIREARARLRK